MAEPVQRPRVNQRKEQKQVRQVQKAQSASRQRLNDWLDRSAEVLKEVEKK